MNRAIHEETLKTRLDNDGQLTGYLDEQINDCPTVKPDMNSVVDEIYTDALMNGLFEDLEQSTKGLSELRRAFTQREMCAAMIDDEVVRLRGTVDEIQTALRKGTQVQVKEALEKYSEVWGSLVMTCLSCAGFLQLDAEKILRTQIEAGKRTQKHKRRTYAAAGN